MHGVATSQDTFPNWSAGSRTHCQPTNQTHMNALKHLFLHELADRYDAEKQLIHAKPKMAKSATSKHLRKLLESHLEAAEGHVKKIDKIFELFGRKASGEKCAATTGLLKESDELVAEFKGSAAIDAALISAAQKIEHYAIASYGCLHEWAALLGNKEAALLLKEMLVEEEAADHVLIELARARCNAEALGAQGAADFDDADKTAKSHGHKNSGVVSVH